MADPKGLYACLDVNAKASDDEIKRAYRRLALQHHPDKNPENQEEAKLKFQQISHAYSILSCSEKRELYDNNGVVGDEDQDEEPDMQEFFDMFSALFEPQKRSRQSSADRMMAEMLGSMFGGVSMGGPFGSAFHGGFTFVEDDDDEEMILEFAASELTEECHDGSFKCKVCNAVLQEDQVFDHLSSKHLKEINKLINGGGRKNKGRRKKAVKVKASRRR